MIAGGVFVSNGKFMRALILSSKHNVSNSRDREIIGQANRLVIWQAISYAKETGHELFDLGGIAPESSKKLDITLAEFKEAFGGERKPCYYYYKIYSSLLKLLIKIKR